MNSSAHLSPDLRYRYWLRREWDPKKPAIAFICLNPSTADASTNDPTVVKLIAFSQRWGYGGIILVNLCAWRATDPREMYAAHRECRSVFGGDANAPEALRDYMQEFGVTRVVAAWGKLSKEFLKGRAYSICTFFPRLDCIKKNGDGTPAHPLYLPLNLKLKPWNY